MRKGIRVKKIVQSIIAGLVALCLLCPAVPAPVLAAVGGFTIYRTNPDMATGKPIASFTYDSGAKTFRLQGSGAEAPFVQDFTSGIYTHPNYGGIVYSGRDAMFDRLAVVRKGILFQDLITYYESRTGERVDSSYGLHETTRNDGVYGGHLRTLNGALDHLDGTVRYFYPSFLYNYHSYTAGPTDALFSDYERRPVPMVLAIISYNNRNYSDNPSSPGLQSPVTDRSSLDAAINYLMNLADDDRSLRNFCGQTPRDASSANLGNWSTYNIASIWFTPPYNRISDRTTGLAGGEARLEFLGEGAGPNGAAGDLIRFTVQANAVIESVSVSGGVGALTPAAGIYEFTMPGQDVTVTVALRGEPDRYPITVQVSPAGSVRASASGENGQTVTEATLGEKVYVDIDGYGQGREFKSISAAAAGANVSLPLDTIDRGKTYRFTMPAGPVTVTVETQAIAPTAPPPATPTPTAEPPQTEEPATRPPEPPVTEPGNTEPNVTEPEPTDPDATEPDTTDPDATDPDATDPDATDPDATDPDATDPDATEPEPTDPDATDPDVTDPGVTDPGATEPEPTAEPGATEPGATEPGSEPTTEPGVSDPSATEPEPTPEPGVTEPTPEPTAAPTAVPTATPTVPPSPPSGGGGVVSGGGGDGGGGSGTWTAPAGSGGQVSVGYTQSGGSVTVVLPDSTVGGLISSSGGSSIGSSGSVAAIDLSGAANATSAALPRDAVSKLTDAALGIEIKLPQGAVALDVAAARSAATQTAGAVSVELKSVNFASLNTRQQTASGGAPVYDVSVRSGDAYITGFGGGRVTVSLPYTLKPGETAAGVTAWRLDDDGTMLKTDAVYNAQTQTVVFTTDHLSLFMTGYDPAAASAAAAPVAADAWVNPFGDVNEGDWFYGDVAYVHKNALFGGAGPGVFSPNLPVSRAMLATVLGRAAGADVSEYANAASFGDVPAGRYYTPYVEWARANAIVGGTGGGAFAPDDPVSRQDLAVMLTNYARYTGRPLPVQQAYSGFADAADIAGYASPAVEAVCRAGIVGGKPGNLFDPRGAATRAEAAAILRRFIECVYPETGRSVS
jgi:hypothetical protein